MRKSGFSICKKKDADQLRGNREADQRLCFRYIDSTISLLPKYEISSLQPSSVVVQAGLCWTWSETQKTGFLTTRTITEIFQHFLTQSDLDLEELSDQGLHCIPFLHPSTESPARCSTSWRSGHCDCETSMTVIQPLK